MTLAAKTTSAAPTFFSPVRNGGYEFVDGGLWANNPTMVGVADALACFDLRREQICVLSLGCVRSEFEMSWARRRFGGLWFWRSVFFEAMYVDFRMCSVKHDLSLAATASSAPMRRPCGPLSNCGIGRDRARSSPPWAIACLTSMGSGSLGNFWRGRPTAIAHSILLQSRLLRRSNLRGHFEDVTGNSRWDLGQGQLQLTA